MTTAADRISIVSRRYCARPTLPAATSAPAMNAGFDAVTSWTSVDEPRVAHRRRARRTCPRRPCSSPRGGRAPTRGSRAYADTTLVRERARGARADRRGEVGAPAGCRFVPENLAMSSYLISCRRSEGRSENRVDERRRFERQAVRPFTPEEVRPSFAADRGGEVGLGTRAAEDARALPVELRPKAAGLEPATTGSRRNPHLRSRPTRLSRSATTAEASCGCEARARTRTSWFRDRRGSGSTTSHGRIGWSGRRDSNSQPPASEAGALPLRHVQVSWVLTAGVEPALTAV